MAIENIERFKIQALRAIAFLYKSFPTLVTVDHTALLKPMEPGENGVSAEPPSGTEHGTILWLHHNSFINGDLQESNPLEGNQKAAITGAQLTTRALRILQKPEENSGGIPLGEVAVVSAFGPHEATAADLVLRRLLES